MNWGIAYSYFHNTEGLDTRFSECDVFHVLGMPARTPFDISWTAKTWQITEDEVSDRLITTELRQAIGRARLVRNPNTVILYTSHKVDGFTERAKLTDENDWKAADFRFAHLAHQIAEREAKEKALQSAMDIGDVDTLVNVGGISERQAYKQTESQRKNRKAERNAQIVALSEQGLNPTQIHRETGIPRSTIIDILKK